MKRLQFFLVLAALTTAAACGGSTHHVTRSDTAPLGFSPIAPDHDGSTSQRAMVDLLSLG
ncbi:hypothetical protein [uncultured Tateyamaria sp.]|uniref:hypothetical protein n=1 Tax=uncultured Tateyamaria sp. TaxID=455651 RepID=UPI00261F81DB|nr:hypothetical protein [uncultured Tateyamaria sp.]